MSRITDNLEILENLEECIYRNPDWRFQQILYNTGINNTTDLFYEESKVTLSKLRSFNIHSYTKNNIIELKNNKECMCLYCKEKFNADDIKDWTDNITTAICPKCGIDAVVPDIFNLSEDDLKKIYERWFK